MTLKNVTDDALTDDDDDDVALDTALAVPPEVVAGSLRDYLRTWVARLRGGESGVLPVVVGLILNKVQDGKEWKERGKKK